MVLDIDYGTVLINLIYDGALCIAVCNQIDGVITFIELVDRLDNAATCIEQTIGHRRQRRSELQARAV